MLLNSASNFNKKSTSSLLFILTLSKTFNICDKQISFLAFSSKFNNFLPIFLIFHNEKKINVCYIYKMLEILKLRKNIGNFRDQAFFVLHIKHFINHHHILYFLINEELKNFRTGEK